MGMGRFCWQEERTRAVASARRNCVERKGMAVQMVMALYPPSTTSSVPVMKLPA